MKQVELYSETDRMKALAKQKRTRIAMIAIATAGLLLCVLFCALTTRKNQDVTLPLTIGTSIAAGWTVISLSIFVYGRAKAAARHAEKIAEGERDGERETLAGRFEKTDEVWLIRNGVTVRKVCAVTGERESMLNVSDTLAKRLPDAFTGKVDVVYGFIVAYEVNPEA